MISSENHFSPEGHRLSFLYSSFTLPPSPSHHIPRARLHSSTGISSHGNTNLKSTGVHYGMGWKGGSNPKLDFPTKFHPNRTKIAKVCYRGGFRVAGQNITPGIQFADIPLRTLNYTFPSSCIQIGLKLPKFLIQGGRQLGWVG